METLVRVPEIRPKVLRSEERLVTRLQSAHAEAMRGVSLSAKERDEAVSWCVSRAEGLLTTKKGKDQRLFSRGDAEDAEKDKDQRLLSRKDAEDAERDQDKRLCSRRTRRKPRTQ
jgi:hypothetical protein